jgi:hypothetical protein
MRGPAGLRPALEGRVGGPVVVALVVLLALIVAIAATWLGRSIVRHDRETEAVRPESTQQTTSGLEAPYAPIPSEPPAPSPPPSSRHEVDPSPAASESPPAPPDPVQHVVWGYVLDETGKTPLAASTSPGVVVTDALGERQVARAGADGAWSISGLESGRWYLSAFAQERVATDAVLDLTPDVSRVRQDFLLEPQPTVQVKLLAPDGRPFWKALPEQPGNRWLSQLVAVATREPPGERYEGVRGSLNNRFGAGSMWFNGSMGVQLPEEYWGVVRLWEDPPLSLSLVLYHDVLDTKPVAPGQEEVTFTLDPATIDAHLGGVELELVDGDTGVPLAGAMVSLDGRGMAGPRPLTGEDGRVRIDRQCPGLYTLWVHATGKADLRREVDVPRGRVRDLGQVALEAAVPIRGRAVDPSGNGVAVEISVCALPAPGALPDFGNRRFGGSADGSFEIPSLGPGTWLLQVKDSARGRLQGNAAEWMAPNLIVDTRGGPVEDLLVPMQPVSAVVVRWTGERTDDLRVHVLDERGLLRQVSGFYSAAPTRIDLLPGTWRLEVVDGSRLLLAQTSFVLGDEPVVLELGPGR